MRYRLGRGTKTLVSLVALAGVVIFLDVMPASGEVVPSEPPLATSSNVQLVGHIPGSAAGMNFKDHYAYVSGWGGITVLDIAQADAPQVVTSCRCRTSRTRTSTCAATRCSSSTTARRSDLGSIMYVLSLANPAAPTVSAVLPLGLTGSGRGSGHIANFSKADCSQAWVDGGDLVEVVDLTVPTAPRSLGKFESAASKSPSFKVSHDTELDSTGTLWSVGGGGAAGYRTTANPLAPQLLGHDRRRGRAIPLRTTTSSSTTPSAAARRCSSPRRTTSTPTRSRPAAAGAKGSSRPGISPG